MTVEDGEYTKLSIEANRWRRSVAILEKKKVFLSKRCRSYCDGICTIDGQETCKIQCTSRGYFIENEGTHNEEIVRVSKRND